MFKKYSKFIILFSVFCFLFSVFCINNTLAHEIILDETQQCDCSNQDGTEACKEYCGDYTLNDFVKIIVNVAHFILSITGSLALLVFIYGGVMFLISAGSSEKIEQAKKIITGAVIGIVIVFASYTIISFIMIQSGFDPSTKGTKWNTAAWKWWEGKS